MSVQYRSPLFLACSGMGRRAPLTCVPLVGKSIAAVQEEIDYLGGRRPELFEVRMDAWDCAATVADLMAMMVAVREKTRGTELILTCRHPREGGLRAVPEQTRKQVYAEVAQKGLAEFVDLELSSGPAIDAVREALRGTATKLVLSAHDFDKTPSREAMRAVLEAEVAAGADVVKLAVMPAREEDVLALLETSLAFRRAHPEIPQIAIAMGTLGMPSRLLGGSFGSDLTFAAGAHSSAPGQIPLAALQDCFGALYGTSTVA